LLPGQVLALRDCGDQMSGFLAWFYLVLGEIVVLIALSDRDAAAEVRWYSQHAKWWVPYAVAVVFVIVWPAAALLLLLKDDPRTKWTQSEAGALSLVESRTEMSSTGQTGHTIGAIPSARRASCGAERM